MRKYFYLLSFAFLFLSFNSAFAQQDCFVAKKILCAALYPETQVFIGPGNNENEIATQNSGNPGGESCFPNYQLDPPPAPPIGEKNSVWYTFVPQSTGQLLFEIIPTLASADFDWIIYNLGTNRNCSEIYDNHTSLISKTTGASLPVQDACNRSSTPGNTGAVVGPTANSPFTDPITVVKGNKYVMCVNNVSGSTSTFTLDFRATNPAIFDNIAPVSAVPSIDNIICSTTKIDVLFDEEVDCSASFLNPSDFEIRDALGTTKVPGITVTSLTVPACSGSTPGPGGKLITLNITGQFPSNGQYSVVVVRGTDLNTIQDLCGNAVIQNTIIAPINVVCADFSVAFASCSLVGVFTDLSGISNNDFTYLYDFNDKGNTAATAAPSYSFSKPGSYNVKQTITKTSSLETSVNTKTVNVVIDKSCSELNFPTGFSPNGPNKEFKVYPRGLVKDFSIKIFDRWGMMVYSSTDATVAWDGKVNGVMVGSGVYAIISNYNFVADNGDQSFSYKGILSITF